MLTNFYFDYKNQKWWRKIGYLSTPFGEKNINMDIEASILFTKIEINQLLDSSLSSDEEELLNLFQQIE